MSGDRAQMAVPPSPWMQPVPPPVETAVTPSTPKQFSLFISSSFSGPLLSRISSYIYIPFWSIAYFMIRWKTELKWTERWCAMPGYFLIVCVGIAMTDITLVWLCLERHATLLTETPTYRQLSWFERLNFLRECDVHIALLTYAIQGYFTLGILVIVVIPLTT